MNMSYFLALVNCLNVSNAVHVTKSTIIMFILVQIFDVLLVRFLHMEAKASNPLTFPNEPK